MLEDMVEYALKLRDSWESLEVALSEENIGVERKYKLGMISRLGLGHSWSVSLPICQLCGGSGVVNDII